MNCSCACHENKLNRPYQHDGNCCDDMNGKLSEWHDGCKECKPLKQSESAIKHLQSCYGRDNCLTHCPCDCHETVSEATAESSEKQEQCKCGCASGFTCLDIQLKKSPSPLEERIHSWLKTSHNVSPSFADTLITIIKMEIDQALKQQRQQIQGRIGFLRQWLNEYRITEGSKMVDNNQIEHWLYLNTNDDE